MSDRVHEILMDQLPKWFKPVLEYIAIMRGGSVGLGDIEGDAERIRANTHVQTADTDTLRYWERLLGISSGAGDTLDYRRERVMTLIEIFDRSPIENLVSTIALEPEQTIYIGTDVKRMQRALPVYREILAGRGIRTELVFRSAAKNDLEATLQVIDAILDGDILGAPTKKIPYFNFEVPTQLKGVDTGILDPRDTYADPAEWDAKAKDLAGRFIKNFVKYESNEAGKALVAAGPQL